MSSGARIGLVVATVVALVVAFVLLSPADDDDPSPGADTTTVPAATADAPAPPAAPGADHEPPFTTIRVRTGEPIDGPRTIRVAKGARVRIQVASQDTTDEVHVHGYDLRRDLEAGDSVRFSFVADAEGIFEIELERKGTQIGELVVEPG